MRKDSLSCRGGSSKQLSTARTVEITKKLARERRLAGKPGATEYWQAKWRADPAGLVGRVIDSISAHLNDRTVQEAIANYRFQERLKEIYAPRVDLSAGSEVRHSAFLPTIIANCYR